MKYKGLLFWVEDDIDACTITDAVITKERLLLDWVQEGDPAHLDAVSADGSTYCGNFGFPSPEATLQMELHFFRGKRGAILYGIWRDTSTGEKGNYLFLLTESKVASGGKTSRPRPTGAALRDSKKRSRKAK
jgi:hypothetical protein